MFVESHHTSPVSKAPNFKMKIPLSLVGIGSAVLTYPVALYNATKNVTELSWIKNFAAIGDSYTAGIGSGKLYSEHDGSKLCSRYNHAYPAITNEILSPSGTNFIYSACVGADTRDISKQIQNLPSDLDLVVFTAGGDDMCLVSNIYTERVSPNMY
jgi:hypothetical protein